MPALSSRSFAQALGRERLWFAGEGLRAVRKILGRIRALGPGEQDGPFSSGCGRGLKTTC